MNYSIEELNNIINNEQLFIEIFNNKKLFLLKELEKNSLFPNKNILKKINNPLIIAFIKKNYQIEEDDLIFFKNKVNYDEYQKLESLFEQKDIGHYFENNQEIPNTIRLSLEHIYKYQQNIKTLLIKREPYIKSILEDSFEPNNIHIDDFLKLYELLDINDLNFFTNYKEFGNIEKYKKIYLFHFKNHSIQDINSFFTYVPTYEVSIDDYDWVKDILKDKCYLSYDELKNHGVTDLFSKLDFFINYDKKNISYFTIEELQNNLIDIQNVLYSDINKREHEKFIVFKYLKINKEQYPILFNDSFIEKIITDRSDISFFVYPDRDISDNKETLAYLYEKIVENINLKFQNNTFDKNIGFHDIINVYIMLRDRKNIEEINLNVKKLGENIIDYMSNNTSSFLTINYLFKVFTEKSQIKKYTPNMFYMLLDLTVKKYVEGKEDGWTDNLHKNIKKCVLGIENNNKKDNNLLSMWNIFQYFENNKESLPIKLRDDLHKIFKRLKVHDLKVVDTFEENYDNVFDFENNNQYESYAELINKVRPEFKLYLLNNGILSENLLIDLLYESDKNLDFLKLYIEKNRIEIEKNDLLLNKILKNKNQNEIYKLISLKNDINNFKEYNEIIKDIQELKEIMIFVKTNKTNTKKNYFSGEEDTKILHVENYKNELKNSSLIYKKINQFSESEAQDYLDDCQKITYILSENIDKLKRGFSFEFLKEETLKFYENKDFNGLRNWLKSKVANKQDLKHVIYNKFESLPFNEIIECLKSDIFIEFIWNSKEYNKNDFTFNSNYTDGENSMIAEIMMNKKIKRFPTDSEQEKEDVLSFFKENNFGFMKKFLIEKAPELMIFSNKIFPKIYRNKMQQKIFIEKLSFNEIVNVFENIYKRYNLYVPINLCTDLKDLGSFLSSAYREETVNDYIKGINTVKEKNPAIYVLLLNHKMYQNFIDSDNKESEHNFLNSIIDIDIYLKGYNILLEQIQMANNSGVAKVLLQCLNQIKLDYEINNLLDFDYKSHISDENINKIITNQFKNNPFSLCNDHYVGISDIPLYLEQNVFDKLTNQEIKDFFQPNTYIFDNQSKNNNVMIDISVKLINHISNSKNKELLEWIIIEVETFLVVQRELSYAEKEKTYANLNGKTVEVISTIVNDFDIESLLETSKLFMDLDSTLISNQVKNKIKRKI